VGGVPGKEVGKRVGGTKKKYHFYHTPVVLFVMLPICTRKQLVFCVVTVVC